MPKRFLSLLFALVIYSYIHVYGASSTISDSIDISHIIVRMTVTDYAGKTIAGNTEIHFTALTDNITSIPFDLLGLTVDSVKNGDVHLDFSHIGELLSVELPTILNTGDNFSCTVFYGGIPDKDLSWGGWYWSGDYSFQLGVGFDANPHNYGRVWFPCFDNFIERSTFRFEITTLTGYKAFCGGILENVIDNPDGTVTWIWNLNQPIPSYLASVAVSTYETVQLLYEGMLEDIPIEIAAKAIDTTKAKNSFVNLLNALAAFEQSYGPYQWDRVGYAVVPFSGGAMEHAMNIAYPLFAITGTTAWESLMAHELAHSWWGNLVTCSDATDMWLNEGWAVFSEHLFAEYMYGEQAYRDLVNANHLEIIHYGFVNDGGNYFALAEMPHDYTYGFTTYNKGAMVAHNLRGYLGDDVFFSCIQNFLSTHAFQPVSSEDLRDFLSSCSGKDMSPFFDGWVFNPGMPAFELQAFEPSDVSDYYDFCIQQKLNHAPDYFAQVPLTISLVNSKGKTLDTALVIADGEISNFTIELDKGAESIENVHLIIDRENKIADAVTAEEFFITTTGSYASDYGKIELEINALVSDTDWMRIEHYWVGADGFKTPVPGLHVNTQRYFRVIGGYNESAVSAEIKYNGTTSISGGYLDNAFISNTDDSLVLLFRANPQEEWAIYPYYELNVWAIITDKRGAFELSQLQEGEYTFGIYNTAIPDAESDINACISVEIADMQLSTMLNLFPNPSSTFLQISITQEMETDGLCIYDIHGKPVYTKYFTTSDKKHMIETSKFPQGLYNVCVTLQGQILSAQKLLIIR